MHTIVIGGGISGLAAAHRLLTAGVRVTLVEASARFGGKLWSGEIAGLRTDFGAESMLARRPEGLDLARAVGLGGELAAPSAAGAAVWTRGALRPMPRGHVMGVPGTAAALAGVVSDAGLARIARDAELPPTELGEDQAIGRYVAARMGEEVVDRLVEPLLGGVYAGDAYRISMRSAVPDLWEAARREPSLLAASRTVQERAAGRGDAPAPAAAGSAAPAAPFTGLAGGLGRLPEAVAAACRAGGATLIAAAPATGLRRSEPLGWTVTLADGREVHAGAVLLAVPAGPAATLLAGVAPAAARELRTVEYASMALVGMAFRRADLARLPRGSGFLVPAVDGRTVKAVTFSSGKWGWAAAQDPELFVMRASIGRFRDTAVLEREDADLVKAALGDLRDAIGLTAEPVDTVVIRWPEGLPQYTVGHHARVARIRAGVAALPGLRVCGAAFGGVGIPACLADAQRAVHELLSTVPPVAAPGRGGGAAGAEWGS
ncbi:protoporphyrinogen oxidase [Streptomyces aidingensis]|uniref:Coproporphyrinogen III oxidase n=1 Tax=Streptomyces aidingensis TaxID=910347 RepID=A0A1I1ILP8_9ACTN|nr:protoporphyrinogen oxidase [Streptomyces aidingensis]SFC37214.1 oxygen-dependent protoporphyrinogen oxidase [Streptomyces aidingensis]